MGCPKEASATPHTVLAVHLIDTKFWNAPIIRLEKVALVWSPLVLEKLLPATFPLSAGLRRPQTCRGTGHHTRGGPAG